MTNNGDINRRMNDSGLPEEVEPSDVNPDIDADGEDDDERRARESVQEVPSSLNQEDDPMTGLPARTSIYQPGS